MMTFWRNFYRVEKSSKFGAKLFWVQGKTNLEGVPRETTIGGRKEGGVRFDLIYPYIHQRESDAESQGEAFRAMFRD